MKQQNSLQINNNLKYCYGDIYNILQYYYVQGGKTYLCDMSML